MIMQVTFAEFTQARLPIFFAEFADKHPSRTLIVMADNPADWQKDDAAVKAAANPDLYAEYSEKHRGWIIQYPSEQDKAEMAGSSK
jgi:hypothetical protein